MKSILLTGTVALALGLNAGTTLAATGGDGASGEGDLTPVLLLAQNNNQNENQNENQNRNTNENQNQNRAQDGDAAAAAAAGDGNQVCFFTDPSYAGNSFCIEPGKAVDTLTGAWNDSISSIQLPEGTTATLCTEANFGGTCESFGASVPQLPGSIDNAATSLKTN